MNLAGFSVARRAALGALLTVLGACSPGDRAADRAANQAPADAALSQGSLFELAVPLTDGEGRTRHMTDLGGAPFVASMIYTSCTSVCPRIIADLQALERERCPTASAPGRALSSSRSTQSATRPRRCAGSPQTICSTRRAGRC